MFNYLPITTLCISAWAVMMDRRQQRLQLVLLPPSLFIPAHQDEASRLKSLEALGETVQPFIIYEETSDIWINVRTNTRSVSVSIEAYKLIWTNICSITLGAVCCELLSVL